MDPLAALAKLALNTAHQPGDQDVLRQAAELLRRRTGAVTVAIYYGADAQFACEAVGQELDLPHEALIYLQQRLVQLRVPLAFNLSGSKVEFITRASNKQRRDFVGWLIPSSESWTEMLVLRGTWSGSAATPLIDFVDSAMPALAMILDGVLETGRRERLAQQVHAIDEGVETIRGLAEMVGSVAAVLPSTRELASEDSGLLQTLAQRAEDVLERMESQRDLAARHLQLQQYTLDYTMRLERTVEAERRNATTDFLTGLTNHRGALAIVQSACQTASNDGRPLSMLLVDIDGFKLFNDTYGHLTGDEILKLVAEVLKECAGSRGTVCRHGGDEFLIVLPGCEKHDARAIADAISSRLSRVQFRVEGGSDIPIGASVGVASFPDDVRVPNDLMSHVDAAMYAAKRRTRPSGTAIASASDNTAFGVLDALVQAIDSKDSYTRAHCDIVAEYAVKLAAQLRLPVETQRALRVAGLLHDVGKLVVPDEILKKPGPLTLDEYQILQRHVAVGEVLIREVPQLNEVIQAVACHHERYDGTGYPRGLAGESIPLIGRVIAIADSYSAMRLDRPYRKGMGHDRVLKEIVAGSGTQFDPELARVFVELLLGELSRSRHDQAA
jgi:diguanylate cyclase (GGDEF)-like protein/putative nucleotidyltransferase with HDIG domain